MPGKHGLRKNVVRETDEVGKGQIRMRTVFEQAIDQRSSTGAWRNALYLGTCLQ
jgi:chromosome partitioning protein